MWTLLAAAALAQGELPQDRVALLPPQQGWDLQVHWQGDRISVSDGHSAWLYDAQALAPLDVHRVGYWGSTLLSQDGSTWVTTRRRTKVWDTQTLDKRARIKGQALAVDPTGGTVALYGGMGVEWIRVQDEETVDSAELWPQDSALHWLGKDVLALSHGEVQRINDKGASRNYAVSELSQSILVAGETAYLPTWNGNLQSLNLDTGELSWLPVHQLGVVHALSPDGDTLAYVEVGSGRVKLYDLRRNRVVRELSGNAGGTEAMSFSPDGSELVTLGFDRLLRVFQVQGERVAGPPTPPLDIGFVDDQVLIAHSDGRVEQWRPDGLLVAQATLPVQADAWQGVHFLPDGSVLYTSTQGSAERVVPWTGKVLAGPYPASTGDSLVATGLDGSYATLSSGWLQSYEPDGTLAGRAPHALGPLQLGPRGAEVLSVSAEQNLIVYDLLHGRSRAVLRVEAGVRSAQISAAGAYDTYPDSGALRVNFIDGNGDQFTWDLKQAPELLAEAGEFWLTASDFSGRHVALADGDGHILLRSLDGALLDQGQLPLPPERYIAKIQVHPDLPLVVAALDDNSVWVLNLSSGERQLLAGRLPGGVQMHAQGESLVWVSQGKVLLSESGSWRQLDFDGVASAAGLLPDGSVVVADERGALSRLEGDTWSSPISGMDQATTKLLINPSGVVVLGAEGGLELRSLDLQVQQILAMDVADAAQAPDGRIIASSPYNGVFEVYPGGALTPVDLKSKHAQALSGPVAACPDGVELLAMDWGWRGDMSLARVDLAKTEVLEVDLPMGITALACTEEAFLVGHDSGVVFRVDRSGERVLSILPGSGSPVTQLLREDGLLWVATEDGVVQRYSLPNGALIGQDVLTPQQVLGAAGGAKQ